MKTLKIALILALALSSVSCKRITKEAGAVPPPSDQPTYDVPLSLNSSPAAAQKQ